MEQQRQHWLSQSARWMCTQYAAGDHWWVRVNYDGKCAADWTLVYTDIMAQEAQLSQRDRAALYVSTLFTLCFTRYNSYKGFSQQKWFSRSLKGIGSGAIR